MGTPPWNSNSGLGPVSSFVNTNGRREGLFGKNLKEFENDVGILLRRLKDRNSARAKLLIKKVWL